MPFRFSRAAAVRTAVVVLAAVLSGVGSYILLIVVAKSTSAAEYSDFAVFWSLTVTVGLGFYYPLEQETAREVAGSAKSTGAGFARFVFGSAGVITLLTGLIALLLFTPWGAEYVGGPGLVLALIASFVGYALQFPVRGMLSGSHKTTSYSSIIAVEGVIRVALPLTLVLVGLTSVVAFALVVAIAAATAVVPVFLVRDRSWLAHNHAAGRIFASRVARLVVAAFSIQLLLNSGTLLARGFGEGVDALLAGQILACLSIARIPVFGYQVLQILYLPRLAAEWKTKNAAGVRSILAAALVAAALVGAAIISVMALLGQWAIGLLFDAGLVLSREGIVLVSLGVSIFILALVVSDGAIAIGNHTLVLRSWMLAVILAAIPALLVDDTLLRATTPLIVGSTAALVQLGIGVLRSYSLRFRPRNQAISGSSTAADRA